MSHLRHLSHNIIFVEMFKEMDNNIKRHNTKLTNEEYAVLLILKSKLIAFDPNINLNDVVIGALKYVHEKGITNSDFKFFDKNNRSK